jgi:hypothetical protein
MNSDPAAELDSIYQWADGLMKAGRLQYLDAAISAFHPEDMTTDNLLGVLTATLPVRSSLPSRKAFYQAVERILTYRGEMGPGLLNGLE